MRIVFPGKPQAKLQAVSTAQWKGLRLIVYISGSALVILGGPHQLLQTIYHDEHANLDGVVIDEETGKIATCSGNEVTVYKPYGENEGVLRWSFQSSFRISEEQDHTLTLSWGSEEELLVGSSSLRLYQTAQDDFELWNCKVPKPIRFASFSHDSNLIATTGFHDRLVKLWRRQSSGSDDTRFDFSYLPHPTAVTGIHWRKPHESKHLIDNVLFSICADSKIRIWAATDPHGLQTLQLCADIDMHEAIQPRDLNPSCQARERYVLIIDSRDFAFGTEEAVKQGSDKGRAENHTLEHLTEIAKANPEVCLVFDRRGNMSAWGLENVGCRPRKYTDKFNIAHVGNVDLSFLPDTIPEESYVNILGFCSQKPGSQFSLLVHHFDGRIIWFESKLDKLFDPSPRQRRLHFEVSWTGHEGLIENVVSSGSGNLVFSRTTDNEGLVWKQGHAGSGQALVRLSSLSCSENIYRTCFLEEESLVVNLHRHGVSIWDARSSSAKQVAHCTFPSKGEPLCVFPLPRSGTNADYLYVAAITSRLEAIVWQVAVLTYVNGIAERDKGMGTRLFSSSSLDLSDDLAFVQPVNQASSPPTTSDISRASAKGLLMGCSIHGIVRVWAATPIMEGSTFKWQAVSTVETGIDPPFKASVSAAGKIAVVDKAKTGLTIWDSRSSQMEHDLSYKSTAMIQDVDWSSNMDDQFLLAVAFPYKMLIFAQMRYDFANAGSAWGSVREINIKELTSHPIGDSAWLGSGSTVVGAGNQLYMYDNSISTPEKVAMNSAIPIPEHQSLSILNLVTYLNGLLPVFHPQLLGHLILAGSFLTVQKVIISLHKALKFFVEGDQFDSFASMTPEDFYDTQKDISLGVEKGTRSSYADTAENAEPEFVTEELAALLNERLAKAALPNLSSHEQIQLSDIVESVASAEKHRRSMDQNAMRYLLFFKQSMIQKHRDSAGRPNTWREFVWAHHSNTQDILVDLISRQYDGRMQWEHATESGLFMWMTDLTTLRAQFEVIARNEYTKTDEKNPIDCSLYYLALKKKSVLIGLWRMASWNREQAGTLKLLRNNFSEPRWKTAALKNAYALLGKRRFEYAAAFFLLAGNLQDAVNICSTHMKDLQLAIAIARVYDGDESPVLRSLLEEKVLPLAAREGNRWLANWAFWMLGRRDMAIRALMSPVHTLIDWSDPPSRQARLYLSSDPALIVLYQEFRRKMLVMSSSKGPPAISSQEEWAFVLQTARTYVRMGCHLLALDLVRNWEFLEQPKETTITNSARKLPRRSSSAVTGDVTSLESSTEQRTRGEGKPAPTAFEEPSASSLLDSFGF